MTAHFTINCLALGGDVLDNDSALDTLSATLQEDFDPTAAINADKILDRAAFKGYTPGQEIQAHMAKLLLTKQKEAAIQSKKADKQAQFIKGLLG